MNAKICLTFLPSVHTEMRPLFFQIDSCNRLSTHQPTSYLTSIYLTFIFHLVLLPVEMIYIIIFYLYSILSPQTYLKRNEVVCKNHFSNHFAEKVICFSRHKK